MKLITRLLINKDVSQERDMGDRNILLLDDVPAIAWHKISNHHDSLQVALVTKEVNQQLLGGNYGKY